MTMQNKRQWIIKVLEKNEKVLVREMIKGYADVFGVRLHTAKETIHEMIKLEIIESDTKYLFLKEEFK